LVRSSRNGEICRTWGGDQRDREEWKISFQELDGLEGLDWEGLEWMEWLEGLEWDGLDWEGLEGLEWLEVVRLEFLELEELDLELQKLQVSEKKMKKKHYIWLLLCWTTSVWKWSLGGDKLEEKWPGLSFVAHWGRGDMLDHVGRKQWKGWNPFQQSGPKAQRFHDHKFDLAGERTVLKIHPRRSAEMCGKNKILWENVLAFHTLGGCGSPIELQGRSRIRGTRVFRCGCGWCGPGKPSCRERWWCLVSYIFIHNLELDIYMTTWYLNFSRVCISLLFIMQNNELFHLSTQRSWGSRLVDRCVPPTSLSEAGAILGGFFWIHVPCQKIMKFALELSPLTHWQKNCLLKVSFSHWYEGRTYMLILVFSGIETHPSKWMPRDVTCVAILGSGTTCGGITAKDEFVYHLWL